jgi:hypothetical protein
VRGTELLPRQVGELVVAEGVRQTLGVVLVDDLLVGSEGSHGGGEGIGRLVGLAVLLLPRLELGEEGVTGEAEGCDNGEHVYCVNVRGEGR